MKKTQKGQVLVEAMVALGAAVVIVGVIAVVVVNSLNNSEYAKNQNLATQYSRQGLQLVRELTETNWVQFKNLSGWYCLYNDNSTITPLDVSDREGKPASDANSCKWTDYIFNRRVSIIQDSGECSTGNAKVSVVVGWNDAKCTDGDDLYCHRVQVDSCFTNINVLPTI